MIAMASRSAGVILVPTHESGGYSIFDVIEGVKKDPVEAQYLYSAARDWEEIEGNDVTAILESATREYWLARTVSHLRSAIGGLEISLEKTVLEAAEEILDSRISSDDVLNRLLVAPLANSNSPVALAKSALSHGCSVVASVFDELADLQPLLRRLTDHWLDLPETDFSSFQVSKEMIWVTVVEKGGMKELLKSSSKHDFKAKWTLLVWNFPRPQSRTGVSLLGKELSCRLFPGDESEKTLISVQADEVEPRCGDDVVRGGSDREAFLRVEKQILAIAKAISEGYDAKAEKFLRELVHEQTSVSGGEVYAVKSLCNIARYCADMFRTDFEIICLDKALELKPFDAWTLIQRGDYLKRIGDYKKALEILEQAQQYGESEVAISSIADVYSEQGFHEEAIRIYKTIPDWANKSAVLTAIADNLRRMGYMEESKDSYMKLINRAQRGLPGYANSEFRAQVGLAEIAKRQGKLDDAMKIYKDILLHDQVDERDKLYYRLGLCNVFKLMEKYEEAYKIVGDVIVKYPFAMEARFIRGSILGLIGEEQNGLEDLPEGRGSLYRREWLRHYYRGLLLFKLKLYEDAKKDLVEELSNTIVSGEGKALLRLGATLWFLREGKVFEAERILSDIPDLHDCHLQYLSLVLRLHSATQKEDQDIITSLGKQIADLGIMDTKLDDAVTAIGKGDLQLAITYVADALLKLAA